MMIQIKRMHATLNNLNTDRSKMISYSLRKTGLKKMFNLIIFLRTIKLDGDIQMLLRMALLSVLMPKTNV